MLNPFSALSQSKEKKEERESIFVYLNNFDSLSVKLEFELDSLLEHRMESKEYEGWFSAYSGDSLLVQLTVKVSARGRFRRKKCDYPPLKLNFPKGQLKNLGFSKSDDYKLVTHCLKSRAGPRVLAKEHLVYQMFSMLTDASYGTKLFEISYLDLTSGNEVESIAFMIESNEELAERQGGEWCKCMGTTAEDIDPDRLELVSLFQFMIGNRDMDIQTEHNVRFLKREGEKLFPYPYDYDFSIFVKAPYAYVSTLNFQPRLYLGSRKNSALIPDITKRLIALRKPYYDLIKGNQIITKSDRKWCLKYLKSFYTKAAKKNFRLPYSSDKP